MKGTISIIVFLAMAFFGNAQTDLEKLKNLKARSIGPAGMSGRVTSIDVVRSRPNDILIGAASGGVWRSTNGGTRWKPIFDEQEILNIGAVAFQQSNPAVMWVGTGEGNPRNSQSSGAGIYKSIDGGSTWNLMGLEGTKTIHRIIVHPQNPDVVFVASLGSAWGPNKERGVFKTTDGGENWEKILFINDTTGCADLVLDPQNPNKLIAAMWQYERKPWFFKSGGAGSGLYISYDAGKTWKKKNKHHGLPDSDFGRIGLAIAASKPNIVYALVESKKTALYRSTNGGENWKIVSTENIGNRPFYYADIYIDPKNENRIFNLYSLVSQSDDGGKSFRVILPYSGVHPDHQALYIHPDDPSYLINGNDGGLNISRDGGKTWRFAENLPLGQFYHINVDNELPFNIYGGMQDNGSWVGPAYKWENGGIRNADFQELLFGDGFDVLPYLPNPRYGYAMYQGGNVYRYDRKTGFNRYIQPSSDSLNLRYNWNAALEQDPFDSNTIYFGSQHVHKSKDQGNSWLNISPDLSTNDSTKQNQAQSGGLTIDATKAENFTSILAIEASPVEKGKLWVGTDDGRLHLSSDAGASWKDLSAKLKGLPSGSWIPYIYASRQDANTVFVIANNYRRNDWSTYAYVSRDGGLSFKSLVKPNIKGYALSIIEDTEEPNLLFLGTEQGLWISMDAGQTWERWKHGVPAVSVMDMALQERESSLVLGTFGRSAFVIDNINPLREITKKNSGIMDSGLYVFKPNDAYMHFNRPTSGVRFTADAHYKAENKRNGALVQLYIKNGQKRKKGGKNEPGLSMKVFDADNSLIRTQKFMADTGINLLAWDMRHDGKRLPNHREQKANRQAPGGVLAVEGQYKLRFEYGKSKDSCLVKLKFDPSWAIDNEAMKRMHNVAEESHALIDSAYNQFETIKEIESSMSKFKMVFFSRIDSSLKDSLKSRMDTIQKSIVKLKKAYQTEQNFKGYDHVTEYLNSSLNRARSLAYQSFEGDNPEFRAAHRRAMRKLEITRTELDTFITELWNPFVEEVTALDLKALDKF